MIGFRLLFSTYNAHNVHNATTLLNTQSRLPDFLIIGAAKSGTTALYHYLKQHPEIFASEARETNFFALKGQPANFHGPGDDRAVNRPSIFTLDAYQALFLGAAVGQRAGEASPLYLYDEEAPTQIKALIPAVKLIVILRNPVDRAYASFLHLVRDGREPCTNFEEALEQEHRRVDAGWEHLWHYTGMGFYARQLARYLEVFDRSQLLVLFYDDFQTDPQRVIRSCFRFLDVDDGFVPDMSRRPNRSGVPRLRWVQRFLAGGGLAKRVASKLMPEAVRGRAVTHIRRMNLSRPELAPAVRHRLIEVFRDDVRRLEEMLGRDLKNWRRKDGPRKHLNSVSRRCSE